MEEPNEMEEQNKSTGPAGPIKTEENSGGKGETGSLKIVGINLLVFVIYTILCLSFGGGDGGVAAFCIAGVHAFICVIYAIAAVRRWVWFLSALLLVVIGFGTCVSTFSLNMH